MSGAAPESPSRSRAASRPLSVSQLSSRISRLLEKEIGRVHVEGEVSNLRVPRSGHAYFVLKDEDAAINCVCFRSSLARVSAKLADGEKLEIRGRVTAYEPRSEYQVIVESARSAGLGDLMRRFIELKDKLQSEGLFDPSRKKPLPVLPRTIGIATSATGAALRDILNILSRRANGMTVLIAPCAVQGDAASREIVRALKWLQRDGRAELIIVGRGGGSIEDLWAFNEEVVVRAIAASKIPVISAVGHETDTTLSDYAADHRAPTPSAAAEIATAGYEQFTQALAQARGSLIREIELHLERRRTALSKQADSWPMRKPLERIHHAMQQIDDIGSRSDRAIIGRVSTHASKLSDLGHRVGRSSPERRVSEARILLGALQRQMSSMRPDVRWRPRLDNYRTEIRHLRRRLDQSALKVLQKRIAETRALSDQLDAVGPESILERGYSFITTARGRKIITDPNQTRLGQTLWVYSAGGRWKATPLPAQEELFDDI